MWLEWVGGGVRYRCENLGFQYAQWMVFVCFRGILHVSDHKTSVSCG